MFALIFILIFVSFISLFVNKSHYQITLEKVEGKLILGQRDKYSISIISLNLIVLILTLFAGFRTSYNDTWTYMHTFQYWVPESLSGIKNIDYSLGSYPGFFIFQIIIKHFFGENPQVLILICSLFYVIAFVSFYYRFSWKFNLSIFLFLTSGLYVFGMAALKQIMAMSIGVYAIRYIKERKWAKFILTVLLASTFHPYILMYLLIPLFTKRVWSKKIVFMILLVTMGVASFETVISTLIGLTEVIGKEYQEQAFLESERMNIIRILVFSVVPILSYFCRRRINAQNDFMLNLSVNTSIIGLLLIIPGYFGGANMFGRLSYYFVPFTLLALPWILYNAVGIKYKRLLILLCFLFYFIFFIYQNRGFSDDFQYIIRFS